MPGESKTETSRCVFIIDDKQVIRAMIYYPLTTGRNTDEISQKLNRPMFKVRSSLREMLEAELISLVEDKYVITGEGKKKI